MSWVESTLGSSFELYQPQTITTKDLIENGKYQVYGANGVIGRYDKFNHEEPQLLITCRGATCGAVNVSSPYAWINGNAMVVKPKSKDVDVRFVEFFFRGAVDLTKAITGAAQPQITRQSLSPIIFRYPPLTTQQKIVAKLDAIFAEIDKATAAAEANTRNAEALFQSYLTEIFECDKDGWTQTKLKDIAEYFNGLTYSPKNVSEDGTIVLRSSNVQADKICLNDIVRVNSVIKNKLYVKHGDILMCSRNGSQRLVGKTATIGNLNERMTFGTFMMIVRSENNFFIEWFFKSDLFKRQIVSGENTMINQITRYMLDEIVIPMPDLSTQISTSKKISNLYDVSQRLKISYLKKIEDLYTYKKSILFKAFSGELVKE